MKAIVYHTGYGCDTGCCGHVVSLEDESGNETKHQFEFEHPDGEYRKMTPGEKEKAFIRDLVTEVCGAEHVADIDFDECVIVDD